MNDRPDLLSDEIDTRVTDVILHTARIPEGPDGSYPKERHFRQPVQVTGQVWIGPVARADEILDAVHPSDQNSTRPNRLYFSRYGFWRTDAPLRTKRGSSYRNWDPDRGLRDVILLSRLVRPTTIAVREAGRIIEWGEGRPTEIVAANHSGHGTAQFVFDEGANWIRDSDVETIRLLAASFRPKDLPLRVTKAMWYLSYLMGACEIDVRWPLLATALEALVHTDDRGQRRGIASTEQFTGRLARLRQYVPELTWSADDLSNAYELRSGFVHARERGTRALQPRERTLYLLIEDGLRAILRAAILRSEVASLFAGDGDLRTMLG